MIRTSRLKIGLFLLLVVLCLPQAASSGLKPLQRVTWAEDISWAAVLDRANLGDDRPILIHFYATWCGPCKLLEAMVYNEAAVVEELADVVTFKVDIEKSKYAALVDRFGITLLPTLLWCTPGGQEVDRFTGYVSAQEFLDHMRRFRTGTDTYLDISKMVAAHPQDPVLLLDLARRNHQRGYNKRSEVLYRRLLNLRDQATVSLINQALLGIARLAHERGDTTEARILARQAAAGCQPAGAESRAVILAVAGFQEDLGDHEGARETYRLIVQQDDHDVAALTGFARTTAVLCEELEEASRLALRAVILSDEDPAAMGTLADCYYRRGLYRKALRWIEKSVTRNPDQQGYQRQRDLYEEALARDPHGLLGVMKCPG